MAADAITFTISTNSAAPYNMSPGGNGSACCSSVTAALQPYVDSAGGSFRFGPCDLNLTLTTSLALRVTLTLEILCSDPQVREA